MADASTFDGERLTPDPLPVSTLRPELAEADGCIEDQDDDVVVWNTGLALPLPLAPSEGEPCGMPLEKGP
jgi:hypothetical protein